MAPATLTGINLYTFYYFSHGISLHHLIVSVTVHVNVNHTDLIKPWHCMSVLVTVIQKLNESLSVRSVFSCASIGT